MTYEQVHLKSAQAPIQSRDLDLNHMVEFARDRLLEIESEGVSNDASPGKITYLGKCGQLNA